jgi:hypothetical protein
MALAVLPLPVGGSMVSSLRSNVGAALFPSRICEPRLAKLCSADAVVGNALLKTAHGNGTACQGQLTEPPLDIAIRGDIVTSKHLSFICHLGFDIWTSSGGIPRQASDIMLCYEESG